MTRAEIEDIVIGFCYGLLGCFSMGWLGLLPAVMSAFYWWYGGRFGHSARVIGCTSAVYGSLIHRSFWFLVLPALVAAQILSSGYGIPSTQPPDEGSVLGRFWYRVAPFKDVLTSSIFANIMTRGTIFLGLAVVFFWTLWVKP